MKNSKIYFSHFDSWSEVGIAASDILENVTSDPGIFFLPWGPKKEFEEGTIVRAIQDNQLYLQILGELYPFSSEKEAKELGFAIENAENVTDAFVRTHPKGNKIANVTDYPPTLAVKYSDAPEVFFVEHQNDSSLTKRYVASFDLLQQHYRVDHIVVLSRETLIPDSGNSPLNNEADFSFARKEQQDRIGANAIDKPRLPVTPEVSDSTSPVAAGGRISNGTPTTNSSSSENDAPDLNISISTNTATGTPSSTILYTLTYENSGTAAAAGVTISTSVPTNTMFFLASSTGSWSCSESAPAGTSCTGTIGTVSAGTSGSVVFAATAFYSLDKDYVTTTVSIADNGVNGTDTDTSNNTDTSVLWVLRMPLTELGSTLYLDRHTGGLYPNASNNMPTAHATAGLTKAAAVQQLDTSGNATSTGLIVMLSIGMTNTSVEFTQFETQFKSNLSGNRNVVVLNAAASSEQYASAWDQTTDTQYTRVLTTLLEPRGYSENQVQVIWLKLADSSPTQSLKNGSGADAYTLKANLGTVVRTLKSRYPNLQQVFLSSRSYAGYTSSTVNPEPYAYESGFAVKWLIEAQINQMENGTVDSGAGNLNYSNGTAPWLAWGPYIWANGSTTSSEGIAWSSSDFQSGGMLVNNTTGANKVRDELWDFFTSSPYTTWFSTSVPLALFDLIDDTYLGYKGGLYPNTTNTAPSAHQTAGLAKAAEVIPRDVNGNASANGKIILLAIGLSNTLQAFSGFQYLLCGSANYTANGAVYPTDENTDITPVNCTPQAGQGYNTTTLAVMNGADGGQVAYNWDGTSAQTNVNLTRVSSTFFYTPYSPNQVQVIWLKLANSGPTTTLMTSSTSAIPEALIFQRQMGRIVRVLKAAYPNLKQLFISPRTYGGYDLISLNPEPYAYEYGFSIKWLIEAQINQMETGVVDSDSGDLDYDDGTAPWIDWGPYIWANASTTNSDGFNWRYDSDRTQSDVRQDDRVHQALAGRLKVGQKLIDFFMDSPYTSWFRDP